MPDNIGLNSRLQKFCSLLAASDGSETTVALYVKAGFKKDASNAASARKKLLAGGWIQAEREKLGLPPIDAEEVATVDDAEVAALLKQARETHKLAVEAGDLKSAAKALRVIERTLKKPAKPGRPTSTPKPTTQQSELPRGSGRPVAELVSMLLDEDDEEKIRQAWPQEKEDAYVAWRNGGDSATYFAAAYGDMTKRTLADGSTVIDLEAPAEKSDLMSGASHAALSAGEIVRRL